MPLAMRCDVDYVPAPGVPPVRAGALSRQSDCRLLSPSLGVLSCLRTAARGLSSSRPQMRTWLFWATHMSLNPGLCLGPFSGSSGTNIIKVGSTG